MNLSDPQDVDYTPEESDDLDGIYEGLRQMRYGGAMDEGEDVRTCLICVTNSLLNLMSYLRKQR